MKNFLVDEIARRYEAGESRRVLGRAYGVHDVTIWRRLRAAGVKMRPSGGRLGWHKRGGSLFADSSGYLRTLDREGKHCFVHRGCWEAYHGVIPDKHVVHHHDEDRRNNVVGNLSCMPKGDHMRLHEKRRREARGCISSALVSVFLALLTPECKRF